MHAVRTRTLCLLLVPTHSNRQSGKYSIDNLVPYRKTVHVFYQLTFGICSADFKLALLISDQEPNPH